MPSTPGAGGKRRDSIGKRRNPSRASEVKTPIEEAKEAREALVRARERFQRREAELEAAVVEAVAGVELRKITLPSGEAVLLPREGMDGQIIAMPNGLTFRVVEGGRAAVQLTDG